ncbi:HYR domain-containing protein [Mariniphaga sediminis]|nr:HYR domain-containing protein [Mariniphaga sediminis]
MDTSYAYPADFQKQFTIHFSDKRLTSFQYISDLRPGKNLVPAWRDACLGFSGDSSINHNYCYVAPLNLLPVYFNIKKQTGVHHSNAPPLVFFAEKKEYQPFKSKNYCQSPADSCILIQEPFLASAIETTLPARLVRPDGADFLWQQIDYDFNRQLLITAAGQGPVLDCPEDISTYTDINTCTSFIAGNLNPGFDENSVITLTWEMTGATNDASPPQGINLIDDYTFSEGVTVVTYTATGTDGSTTSCFFTITISDNQVPRIESMPSDITVVANPGECTAVVYWSEPIVSDNCTPSHQIIKESTVDPGEVFSVGSTHVLYRAFDAMGNESAVQSFTVTVEDKEPPVLVLPGNLTIHCGDVIPAPWQTWQQLTAAGGNAADNCALDESTFSLRSETASAENCPYVLTRTYEVADAHGNIATAQHRITVEGEEPVLKSGQGVAATVTYTKTDVTCNGGNDGTADLTISNITGTLTITWSASNGGSGYVQGNEDQTGLTAGDYSVDITDDSGTETINFTLSEPLVLSANVTSTDISCNGANDGTITVSSPSGGYGTYEYRLNSGTWQSSGSFSGLSPNSYSVQIRDAANPGCTVTLGTENITQPAILNATVSSTNISCNGANDGTITVSAPSGGYGTYEYRLNSGTWQSSGSFSGLSPNSYSVQIRDAANPGCTVILGTENITQPAVLNATVSSTNISCNGANDGTITVSSPSGGYGTYEYRLNSGTWQSSGSFSGLSPNSYSVQIRDAANPGCTVTLGTENITQPAVLNATVSSTNISCNGATDGTIIVSSPSGGYGTYEYRLNSGTWQSSGSFSGLSPNSYSVQIRDAANPGCSETLTTENITQPDALIITSHPLDQTDCKENQVEFSVSVDNAVGTVNYQWQRKRPADGDFGNVAGGNSATLTVTNIGVGGEDVHGSLYRVIVTDNCQAITSNAATLNVNEIIDLTPNQTSINICNGGSVTYEVFTQGDVVGYEWKKSVTVGVWTTITDGGAYSGATTSALTISNATANESASYRVFVTFNTLNQPAGYPTCIESSDTRVRELVVDDEGPVAICQDITVQLDAAGNATIAEDAVNDGSSDNCGGILTFDTNITSFNCSNVGTNPVELTVTDSNGNTSTCNAIVTVEDNISPTVATCPANISVASDPGNCTAVVNYTAPTFDDNCDGTGLPGTLSAGFSSGQAFPVGVTTVTYQYTDAAGNGPAECSFTVTVTDSEVPVITCPADISVNNSSGFCYATAAVVGLVNATATDNCNPSPTVTGTRSDGLALNVNYPVGITTITWEASDGSNVSTCEQTVEVIDSEGPTFTVPTDITIYVDATCNENRDPVQTGNPINAKDNCTSTVNLTINYSDGAEVPGSCTGNYSFTRTWTVTDAAGNSTSKDQVITVRDNIKPVITVPSNISIACSDSQDPSNTGQATATDNCSVPTITFTDSIGNPSANCANNYTIFRTWIATDLCGNQKIADKKQEIFVSDNKGPEVVFANQIVDVSCPDDIPVYYENLAEFLASDASNDAYDLCSGSVTMELYDEFSFFDSSTGNAGYCPDSVQRTYRFYDECLKYTDVVQTIIVSDLSACTCTECTDKVKVYDVDLRANPDSVWARYNERKDKGSRCCLDDVWWEEGGNDPYRCVSFNVIIDDNAVGVQIETSKGQDAKEWRVDCENVSLEGPDGDIICLPSGEYHLFTHCKQGADPIDYIIRSVRGIIESDDIATRVDCAHQIHTTGDFESTPVWSALNPLYDQYLDTSDPYNPIFYVPLEDKDNVPATIDYQVCADVVGYICGQSTDGTICDTITVQVLDPIEIELNIDTSLVCVDDPLSLVADVSPASSYYEYEWYDGPGGTGNILSNTNTLNLSPPIPLGDYSIRVTDYDPNGLMCNTDVVDFTLEADTTGASVFSPTSDLYIQCNDPAAAQQIQDWLATATAEDDFGNPLDVTNDYNGITHACGTVLPVVFSAVDICGNIGTDTAYIHVTDVTPPVITTDASDGSSDCSTLDPNDDPGYLAWLANNGGAIATDECDDDATLTWTNNSATQTWSGDPANNQITITFIVSDACGNTAETTATYSIIDDQRPTITCPSDVQETAALNDCYKILVTPTDPTMGDNCSVPTLSWEMTGATTGTGAGTVTGESFNVGITTVMYVATDAAGLKDTCYFDVTIIDLNPPIYTLDCPEDISVNADAGICGSVLSIPPPPVEDPCGEPVTLLHDSPYASDPTDASGTYPVGATVITWTATDASGNTATCEQTVTVTDTQKPTITCPGDVVDQITDGGCSLVSSAVGDPTFTDNCSVDSLIYIFAGATTGSGTSQKFNYASGVAFNVGVTTVTYVAFDAAGLTDTCSHTVWIKNLNAPRFSATCPSNVSVSADAGICGANLTIPVPAINNPCGEAYMVSNDWPSATDSMNVNGYYPVGTTIINWTITDASGNVTTCEQTIEVIDDQRPVVNCPPDVEDQITDGGCSLVSSAVGDPTFTDNCSVDSLIYILAGATTGSGTSQKFNYASGVAFNVGVTTVTYVAFDAAGLTDTCSHTVWIKNLNAPQFNVVCPPDVVQDADPGECYGTVSPGVPVINNPCGEAYTVSNNWPSAIDSMNVNGVYPIGTTTINWTIVDASGNVYNCTQNITVNDLLPTLICPPDILVSADFEKDYASGVVVPPPTFDDNCPDSTLTWVMTGATTGTGDTDPSGINIVPSPNTFNVGVTTIEYTFTDAHGHVVTCSFTVTVESKPVIECPPDTTVYVGTGGCTHTFDPGIPDLLQGAAPIDWTWEMTGATTGSGSTPGATPLPDFIGDTPFNLGTTTITWTATNVSGADTCFHIVTVLDTIPPTFTPAPYENCVDPLHWATYNPANPNPVVNHVDPNLDKYPVDLRTLPAGDTSLDLLSLEDNCCDSVDMIINWRIDFSNTPDPQNAGVEISHGSISGTGQPSAYGSDIQLWGDGVLFSDITHTITFWVEDCNGNVSQEQTESIVITPRPQIIKQN